MSPRISSPVTAPRSTGLTHPCPHDDHVQSRSIREELRNRRKMPTRHFFPKTLIAGGGPRVRTRAGRGCRSHGLRTISLAARWATRGRNCVPAPLTLRMMERVWSSMNSTRHWVTPPREPVWLLACVSCGFPVLSRAAVRLSSSFFLVRCLNAGVAYRYGQGHE